MNKTLSDLIEIPDLKLVIELDDADIAPAEIINSFILTKEVRDGLHSIISRINSKKGCGIFVKGNFGIGKSHFLSFLYLLLKRKDHPLLDGYGEAKGSSIHPVKISLIPEP